MSYKAIETGKVLEWIKENYLGKKVQGSRSKAGNWMQLTLEHIEKGNAVISMEVRPEMTNTYGNIHGGMMCLAIDEAIGWAIVSLDSEVHYTSINLAVDFLYSIKEGDRLKVDARIIRHGKKIINAACHVYDMNGTLLAIGHSNLVSTNMKMKEDNI